MNKKTQNYMENKVNNKDNIAVHLESNLIYDLTPDSTLDSTPDLATNAIDTNLVESNPLVSNPLESVPSESEPLESVPPESVPPESEPLESDPLEVMGIDLGTRFSCVSVWRNKKCEIICDQFGNRTIPSVVSFYRSAKLVGHNALSMKDVNPANTIYDIKRVIGRKYTDPIIEQVQKIISYELIDDESKHHNILVKLDAADGSMTRKKEYKPEEICAYILIEIRNMVETYLKKKIVKSVITVPAYFNDAQRQATLDAAKIAGLEVLKIINEPTAAALMYGMGKKFSGSKNSGNVVIYDFGAGTLDISLMNICNGSFKTLAYGANMHLGGEDIDYLMMDFVIRDFRTKHHLREFAISKLAQVKLKNAAENAKKILSVTDKAVVCVDDFYNGLKLYYVFTRDIFEMICNKFFVMCIKPLSDALESAGLHKTDIDEVILVGGSTRIPKIQKLILDFFKDTKIKKLICSLNPDEVVSAGASIYGYIMTHQDDPFTENLVLLDITPLSLGVETLQKQMTVVIPRNTVIPTRKNKTFSTDTDDQNSVDIKVYEGERKQTKNNFHIGTFELSGFEKGPRGFPTIKIIFHIDLNGILHVSATEKKSGVENSIIINSTWSAKGRLSKNDIDSIISEAEKNEEFDMLYSTKIGLIHNINSICNAILFNLKDDAYNLTLADKKKIRLDIKHTLKWLNNKDFNDVDMDELKSRESRLSKLYAPLIAQVNKKNQDFKDSSIISDAAEIHGDDENSLERYDKITIPNDPSEYDKEEMRALKQAIMDLTKNVISVVNNPVSSFNEDDILLVSDYLDSVNIWLFTTNATTTIEYVAKINEINKFTDDIMKKYENKQIFNQNETFTCRDELQLTCLTLNTSVRSNYFSLKSDDMDKLNKLITNTMIWLVTHQNEPEQIYQNKINEINDICNVIYHSMHKMKVLENLNMVGNDISDSEDENDENDEDEEKILEEAITTPPSTNDKNKINENIKDLLDKLPNKLIRDKKKPQNIHTHNNQHDQHNNIGSDNNSNNSGNSSNSSNSSNSNNTSNSELLLKIDLSRLNSSAVFRYKNIEMSYR